MSLLSYKKVWSLQKSYKSNRSRDHLIKLFLLILICRLSNYIVRGSTNLLPRHFSILELDLTLCILIKVNLSNKRTFFYIRLIGLINRIFSQMIQTSEKKLLLGASQYLPEYIKRCKYKEIEIFPVSRLAKVLSIYFHQSSGRTALLILNIN